MILKKIQIIFIFILIYNFINSFPRKFKNLFRILNEANNPDMANAINKKNTSDIEEVVYYENCSEFNDCFNCTVIPTCRWIWSNQTCISYRPFVKNYSIPVLNNSYADNNITILNSYVNFIRKVCFLPYIPFMENNNSLIYNNISVEYCGQHHITTPISEFSSKFRIELNNMTGMYGLPNLLCEYIILSGPSSFDANIEINAEHSQDFFLLYSEDSRYFSAHINESRSFGIYATGRKANTFVYYGLESFNSSPFTITFKQSKESKSSQRTGYIMIGIIIFAFIIVVSSIIYIRNNSILFNNKKDISEEEEKFGEKSESSTNYNPGKSIDENSNQIINHDIGNNTPDKLIAKEKGNQFNFDNANITKFNDNDNGNICCLDNKIIKTKNEAYHAKCGHTYHIKCYNNLLNNIEIIDGKKELKCVNCQNIIYP
jgi:hypothetical protein